METTTTAIRNIRNSNETKRQERKRNIYYLIKQFLEENGFQKLAAQFAEEANLSPSYTVCDNIDLDMILQDYINYYYVKFNKNPNICKKVPLSENEIKNHAKTQANENSKREKRLVHSKSASVSSKSEKEKVVDNTKNFELFIEELKLNDKQPSLSKTECNIVKVEESVVCSDLQVFSMAELGSDLKEMSESVCKELLLSSVTWDDCIGQPEAIQILQEAIMFPVMYPELFNGVAPWGSVLLYGPPGTGKTMMAHAMASTISTFNVTPSSYISKFRGDSEKLLKALFATAKSNSPCAIFIDELDALGSTRDDMRQHEASRRFKAELLHHMDTATSSVFAENVFILATTNLPWEIDPAILRRFDKKIFIDLPNKKARSNLFKVYLSSDKIQHDLSESDFNLFAANTENFSAHSIKLICKEAKMMSIRSKVNFIRGQHGTENILNGKNNLTKEIIQDVIGKSRPVSKNIRDKYLQWQCEFGGDI